MSMRPNGTRSSRRPTRWCSTPGTPSRWRWGRSTARSTQASRALASSRNLRPNGSILSNTAESRCSAPAASAARKRARICSRAALPRSITSRAAFSNIWKRCRRLRVAGAANASCSTNGSRSVMVCSNLARNNSACKNLARPNEIRTRHVTNEIQTLGERIDTLETRLAYQDDAIETLNQTITAQWKQIDALTRRIAELGERLQEAEANAPGAANERPPHY